MRILLVAHERHHLSGVQRVIEHHEALLRTAGHSPSVCYLDEQTRETAASQRRTLGRSLSALHNPSAVAIFLSTVDKQQPDLVHFQHLMHGSPLLPRLIAERNIPVVVTLHDFWLLCGRITLAQSSGELCTTPRAGRCLSCLSSGNKLRMPWQLLVTSARRTLSIQMQHPAIIWTAPSRNACSLFEREIPGLTCLPLPNPQPEMISPLRAKSRAFRVVYASGDRPHKGAEIVRRAMALLPQSVDNFSLTTYDCPVSDPRVIARPSYTRGELDEVFRDADALLLPSLWREVQPLLLGEGRAYGIPFIGSDVPGIREYWQHYGGGMLFPMGDAAALAAIFARGAMIKHLEKTDIRSALGIRPSRMNEHPNTHLTDLQACYQRALDAARRSSTL